MLAYASNSNNSNSNNNNNNNNEITIALKLMKIVVQSHNPKTYICSNSDNAQQEV